MKWYYGLLEPIVLTVPFVGFRESFFKSCRRGKSYVLPELFGSASIILLKEIFGFVETQEWRGRAELRDEFRE